MASDELTYKYPLKKLSRDGTLKIEIISTPEWKIRLWMFRQLMMLACWILGCGIVIEDKEHD